MKIKWRNFYQAAITFFLFLFIGTLNNAFAEDIKIVSLASVVNSDGRFEAFAIGGDGNIYHRWQVSKGSEAWSDWTLNIAGKFTRIEVRLGPGGKIFLFGLDGGHLIIRQQLGANAPFLPESFTTGELLVDLAVATNNDNKFEILAIGGNGVLWEMSGTGAQTLAASSWSGWSQLGGHDLDKIVAERDGDGRITVVALGNDKRLYSMRQISSTQMTLWTDWISLGNDEVGAMALGRGKDRTLWLAEAGVYEGLFIRSLLPTTEAGAEPGTVKAIHPQNGHVVKVTPKQFANRKKATPSQHVEDKPDAWTARTALIGKALFRFDEISIAVNSKGLLDLFATGLDQSVTSNNGIVHFTQDKPDSWPDTWSMLPLSPKKIKVFGSVSFSINRSATSAVFAEDKQSGRAWVLVRDSSQKWSNQIWRPLGRVSGGDAPDLYFQSAFCLNLIDGVTNADALRQNISDGVTDNLKSALSGTPIGNIVDEPQSTSICTDHGEVMGLWLNHAINMQLVASANIIQNEPALFALLLPEATIKKVFGEVWKKLPRNYDINGNRDRHGSISLDSYDVKLRAPNQLIISIAGTALSLNFNVYITARFGVVDKKPSCDVQINVDTPKNEIRTISGFIAGLFMAAPVNYLEDKFAAATDKVSAQGAVLCDLSQALVSELFLPVPDNPDKAQMLELPYDRVMVIESGANAGILGVGIEKPFLRTRAPHVDLTVSPVKADAGPTKIQVGFRIKFADLKLPIAPIEWLPSYGKATRLLTPANLNTDTKHSLYALFEYEVEPSNIKRRYNLGVMTVTVKGVDGISSIVTEDVTVEARPR